MNYRPYNDLPPLAGISTLEEASLPGLSVENCVSRLKRLHWSFRRLHQIFIHRLVSEPVYELKMGFSLHAHYCAEHAAALRKRVAEMREPPLGLEHAPDAALDIFFDEILSTPDTAGLLSGIYSHAVPALQAALRTYIAQTHALVDHPSLRVCRFALLEIDEMADYGAKCVQQITAGASGTAGGASKHEDRAGWEALLQRLLAQSGSLDGSADRVQGTPVRLHSDTPYAFDPVPKRDERFADPYNMGVHAEVFLYDEKMPVEAKPLMLYYKRLREIDVPEVIAAIIAQTAGKPWEYTVDLTRQLWDEARHAMMGEVGFVRAGIDWRTFVPINFTWSLALNTQLGPLERHAVLYFIEQGLMPKTGKRFEWEVALASGDAFAGLAQDFDWADEVLHARIGRDWYVKEMGDAKRAIAYGDECWSRVLIDWEKYRSEGLTGHANWWQPLYLEWCRIHGKEPNPLAASFQTNYSAKRADLRELSISG